MRQEVAAKVEAINGFKQRLAALETDLQLAKSTLAEKEQQVAHLSGQLEQARDQCRQAQTERERCEEELTAVVDKTRAELQE